MPLPPHLYQCPGNIRNQVFGVTVDSAPEPTGGGYVVAVDGSGNFGAAANLYAGGAIVAGAGSGTAEPSPSAGSLVSHTGPGTGDILLGSSGTNNYVKCDYGETVAGKVVCNEPLVVINGGVQPDGGTGGFSPEAYPAGDATPHPQILSGSCAVNGSFGDCTFPNSFSFADATYHCSITVQGTTPLSSSYAKNSTSQIAIYNTAVAGTKTYSYICTQ